MACFKLAINTASYMGSATAVLHIPQTLSNLSSYHASQESVENAFDDWRSRLLDVCYTSVLAMMQVKTYHGLHTGVVHEGKFYLAGTGLPGGPDDPKDDIRIFDFASQEWMCLALDVKPTGCKSPSLVGYNDQLILFGGMCFDLDVYHNMQGLRWRHAMMYFIVRAWLDMCNITSQSTLWYICSYTQAVQNTTCTCQALYFPKHLHGLTEGYRF